MAISVSLAEAVQIRNNLRDAYLRACNSSEYRIGTRMTRHQDVAHLRKEFTYWDNMVSYLEGRGPADEARQGVPVDR
jgi:hypothetical protein